MANHYARLIKQKKFKHHTSFSAAFYKNEEEDQRSNEIVDYSYLKKYQNLTDYDIINIDDNSQLEH